MHRRADAHSIRDEVPAPHEQRRRSAILPFRVQGSQLELRLHAATECVDASV